MRSLLVVLVGALISLGGIAIVGVTLQAQADVGRGFTDPFATTDLPVRVPSLGVNAELLQYDAETLDTQLNTMRQLGIYWIRQEIRWDVLVSDSSLVDYAKYDGVIQSVDRAGLKLVAVLIGAPRWARVSSAEDVLSAPPRSAAAFAAFAATIARRYGEHIDYYQIWDEPNIRHGWGNLDPQPASYAALLAAAAQAIRANDPVSTIIAAALAPTAEQSGQNISDWRYLQALYDLGASPYFAAAAGKPYGFSAPPDDRLVRESVLNFSRFVGLREVMMANGDHETALWASNFGWNALPADWNGAPSIWGSVSVDQQAAYTTAALARSALEWPWAGGLILHHWQPVAPCDDPVWGFAVISCTGEPTALFSALQAESPLPLTALFSHATTQATYAGLWTFSPMGADIGWVQDSSARFTFEGEAVGLRLRQGAYSAFLYITIDGEPANALPKDVFGRAYINLSSDTATPSLDHVLVAQDLAPGPHTLELTADKGWDQWALAGFVVRAGQLPTPQIGQMLVALATTGMGILITLGGLPAILNRLRGFTSPGWGAAAHFLLTFAAALGVMFGLLWTFGSGFPNVFRRDLVNLAAVVFTAGLIYLQPPLVLLIISMAVLLWLLVLKPENGLVLTLLFAPFFLFPVELYRFAFPMAELAILATTVAAVIKGFIAWSRAQRLQRRAFTWPQVKLNGMDLLILLWFFAATAALAWSEVFPRAATEWRVLFLEPLLFYGLARLYARDRAVLLRLIDAGLAAASVVCLIGLIQYATGQNLITAEGGAERLASVYGSPNNVALYLGRQIPFALAFVLLPVARIRRLFASVTLALCLITVALTQSAGALFIGLPFSIALVAIVVFGRRSLIALVGLTAGAAAVLALVSRSSRFSRLLDFSQGTNFFRLRVWQSALDMIQDRPWTGFGLDQFLYAYRGVYLQPDAWQEPNLSHPHNIILDVWLRLGIFGIATLIAIQVWFWVNAVQLTARFRHNDTTAFALVAGAMGSMASLLSHGMVDNSLFVMDLAFVFTLLLLIISNIRAIDVDPKIMV